MKIFQIFQGFCHWDATKKHPTLESTIGRYAPDVIFVEAPDNVFEGWGFDETLEGDARFVQPTPPDGWLYDKETGTFYPEKVKEEPSVEEKAAAIEAKIAILQSQLAELKSTGM